MIGFLPFASDEFVENLARGILKKDGLRGLAPIMPFVDPDIIEEHIKKRDKA